MKRLNWLHRLKKVIVFNRKLGARIPFKEYDVDYDAFTDLKRLLVFPLVAATLHILLYTSGTTGKPKGVVRDTGGYAVALKFSMQSIYNVKAGEVFWAASDVGWVVGHSFIVYGPLINRNTSILFEGKPIKNRDVRFGE
jgi:propionyl-CoA synthetase